jgi:CheY-like chemotaxis protein
MYHPTLGSDHDKGQTQAGSMKDNGHILVVDDQREICDMVQEYLSGEGYQVSIAQDGVRMRRVMAQSPIDLVILDLILPGEDGLTLARWLRENFRVGIIMLTGRGDIVDHILGLEMVPITMWQAVSQSPATGYSQERAASALNPNHGKAIAVRPGWFWIWTRLSIYGQALCVGTETVQRVKRTVTDIAA